MAQAATPTGGVPLKSGVTLSESDSQALRDKLDNREQKMVVYSADGAIDPTFSHTAVLTKGSAAAMTLAAPTDNGVEIIIQAGSAFAHVTTATGLIQDGVTGGAKNTYTSAAFVGSGATLAAYEGKWHLISKNLGATA